MATKRHLESGPLDSDEPQAKRPTAILPPISIGSISSLEEMDMKMLQFQNKKLWERIEVRRHAEAELNEQLETVKAKLTATESTMSVVYRYWDQLDENTKVVLRRLDVHDSTKAGEDDDEIRRKSFHRLLGDRDFQDIKENVSNRLEFTRDAFVKIVNAILKVQQNNSSLAQKIGNSDSVDDAVKKRNKELEESNKKLQQLTTELQAAHNKFTLERESHEEKIESLDERIEELQEAAENARWELKKTRMREDRLTRRLAEALEKLSKGVSIEALNANSTSTSQVSSQKNPEKSPTDDDQIIAESRLQELEKLKIQHQEALKELEKYKVEVKNIPDSRIQQSAEYRTLKSQFSVLFNESVQMKQVLDESRTMLQLTRNNHLRRIEQLECDELQTQRKLRNELIQLEDTLAKVRHDYEAIHAELEQNLAANEQAGPVNREMRHLINSLQNHNRQLKGEIQRYKKKMKDLQSELSKSKQNEINRLQAEVKQETSPPSVEKPAPVKQEEPAETPEDKETFTKEERDEMTERLKSNENETKELKDKLRTSEDQTKELRLLLDMYKGLSKEQREKAEIMGGEREAKMRCEELEAEVTSLKRKMTSLEGDCRRLQKEITESQNTIEEVVSKWQKESDRADRAEQREKERHIVPDAETTRKMKVLEETIAEQRRNLASTKQEEEALLAEMDVTGQAFEDMQEQNMRLLQQLREKDDANFKLMSERIKANQIQKLLQEEKSVLQDQAVTLHMQVEAQNQVVRLLEEKERGIQNQMVSMEKEVLMRTQAMELHKRKAVETVQATEDMRRELDKYKEKVGQLQEQVDEKVESLLEQHFKLSRLQEDAGRLRRKLDKHKKTELYSADEVLMEEIKEYKTKLRCPCCNVNNKDAVLTKCFHVFCIKCIKTRYETRQRKCPKCNAGFGGNDFHRIYIE